MVVGVILQPRYVSEVDICLPKRLTDCYFELMNMCLFISRELNVFRSEFDFGLSSEELVNAFTAFVVNHNEQMNINSKNHICWIMAAVEESKIIGYCYFHYQTNTSAIYISHIFVDEEYRNKRIGLRLFKNSLNFIFRFPVSLLEVYFTSTKHKTGKLVKMFRERVAIQNEIDVNFKINATAHDEYIYIDR